MTPTQCLVAARALRRDDVRGCTEEGVLSWITSTSTRTFTFAGGNAGRNGRLRLGVRCLVSGFGWLAKSLLKRRHAGTIMFASHVGNIGWFSVEGPLCLSVSRAGGLACGGGCHLWDCCDCCLASRQCFERYSYLAIAGVGGVTFLTARRERRRVG